ncbi:Kelch repeat-containing protein [Hyalangium gracile]|uniref:Kelch repeat-containing protein n=1 Tax=Hyalangium gracile TaxID=394092 RepID=UPI001CCF843B|nr:kelch repeat-containing protein [Hyalangium gracile]
MKRASLCPMLALAAVLLAGCTSSGDTGTARFAVAAPQSLSSDITRVVVTSGGADIASVSVELFPTDGVWGGIIGNIPAGTDRTFLAQAFDVWGTLLFEGSASGVTISSGQTTLVAITLQQLNPPPPFENEAPLIDSLVASTTTVAAGGTISLVASAHDPNPGDTLTYAWAATAGSFSSSSEPFTSWTAPASTGIQTLTLVVTDSRGLSSSVLLAINVQPGGEGEAELSISFNSAPEVLRIEASPTRVSVGRPTSVSVTASDLDGDSLSYSWSASCAGIWVNASSSTARFTPSLQPAAACNNCRLTVTVSDGRGSHNTGTVALCVSNTPPINHLEPVIVRTYRSSDTASPGQELTYQVEASDPQGSALTFSWVTNIGALERPNETATRSRIGWRAPSCVSAGLTPTITVTVTNAFNLTTTRSFTVAGLPTCSTSTGWTSTGTIITPRLDHTATLLPNGKVLIVGGLDISLGPRLAEAELYDPVTGTWSATGSMHAYRYLPTATVLLNGKVLVSGGEILPFQTASAELYDPETGTWSVTGSMHSFRAGDAATLLPDGRVLISGGSAAEVYDPETGTWSLTGAPVSPLGPSAALLPDGTVLAVQGSVAQVYDPASNSWSLTGAPLVPVSGPAVRLLDGRVLIVGGGVSELYDPATGTWSLTGPVVEPRSCHTATLLLDGRVLVAGGCTATDAYSAAAELYDPASNTWSATAPMFFPREEHTATRLANGKVLVVGGFDPYLTRISELYTP